jgi:hypothetical protein
MGVSMLNTECKPSKTTRDAPSLSRKEPWVTKDLIGSRCVKEPTEDESSLPSPPIFCVVDVLGGLARRMVGASSEPSWLSCDCTDDDRLLHEENPKTGEDMAQCCEREQDLRCAVQHAISEREITEAARGSTQPLEKASGGMLRKGGPADEWAAWCRGGRQKRRQCARACNTS